MHILHIIRTVRRESGGPAEGLRRILDGYLVQGHTAEVLTLDPATPLSSDLPVPLHALGTSSSGYGYSSQARLWLRNHAGRFRGIVVHGLWQYPGLLALQELAGRHTYAVFTHGMLDPWFNRTYPFKFLKKLPYWLAIERRVLHHAYRVLFTSSVEASLAPTSFPFSQWTPAVVPYGTAGPPPGTPDPGTAFYAATGLPPGTPFLLYAGRIQEKKGCDLLLHAYATVSAEAALPMLVMAGPDQEGLTARLQALAATRAIQHRVIWPGMLTGLAKWDAFREAEAFILPSHQENFGIAVAEALSCGTPVLISNQVNIHADVTGCAAGYVEPDTLEGTTSLLRRWLATAPAERHAITQPQLLAHPLQQRRNVAGTCRALFPSGVAAEGSRTRTGR